MPNVRAIQTGFYGGKRRDVGEAFVITSAKHFSKIWMESLEGEIETDADDEGFKPKTYTACPKLFENDDKSEVIKREDVLSSALETFTSQGNEVEAWNELEDKERRTRMLEEAVRHFAGGNS